MMGSGKTAVAKELAKKLEWAFLDTDHIIETELHKTISSIFQREGEPFFRKKETQLLKKLAEENRTHTILATGGGIVLQEENRECLRGLGHVIYLSASPETLFEHIEQMKDRPLLPNGPEERRKKLALLVSAREPLYRETAHRTVTVDHKSIEEITREILK